MAHSKEVDVNYAGCLESTALSLIFSSVLLYQIWMYQKEDSFTDQRSTG